MGELAAGGEETLHEGGAVVGEDAGCDDGLGVERGGGCFRRWGDV